MITLRLRLAPLPTKSALGHRLRRPCLPRLPASVLRRVDRLDVGPVPLGTARGAAGALVAVGVILTWLSSLASPDPRDDAPTVMTALAVVAVAWAVELLGVRWPRPLFLAAVMLPITALHGTPQAGYVPLLLVPVVAWLGYAGRRRWGVLALVLGLLNLTPYAADRGVLVLPWTCATVVVWLASRGLAVQDRLLAQLRTAQADLAHRAAEEERRRIAGEIHDLVAHSLAVMVLHLTGARMVLQRDGADARAIAAIVEAESQGRRSLDDVRRTVGLLRDERGAASAVTPLPTLAELPALVAQYRAAGLDAALLVEGDLAAVPGSTGLALYRIAQEALANVVKHTPGASAAVELSVGERLRLRVRNPLPPGAAARGASLGVATVDGRAPLPTGASDPRGVGPGVAAVEQRAPLWPDAAAPSAGLGVAGMAERARLLGGTLSAGPAGDSWLVECTVPGPAASKAAATAAAPEPAEASAAAAAPDPASASGAADPSDPAGTPA
jgi:signal transduction histidine kinase